MYVLEKSAVAHLLPPVSLHLAVIVLLPGFEFLLIHDVLPPDTLHVGGVLSIFTVWSALQFVTFPALSFTLPPELFPFAPAVVVSILEE